MDSERARAWAGVCGVGLGWDGGGERARSNVSWRLSALPGRMSQGTSDQKGPRLDIYAEDLDDGAVTQLKLKVNGIDPPRPNDPTSGFEGGVGGWGGG